MATHISLDAIIAASTIFFAVLVKLVGIPDQIRQNFKRKSTEGVSLPNQLIGFIAYIFWTLHGMLHHDPILIYGQLLGVIVMGILLYQFVLYRKPKADRGPHLLSERRIALFNQTPSAHELLTSDSRMGH